VEELSVSGSFHVALSAFNKAEFDTAYQLFSGLAGKGIAEAQINIGMMFEKGKGFHKTSQKQSNGIVLK
jgi:TPR repeat protein